MREEFRRQDFRCIRFTLPFPLQTTLYAPVFDTWNTIYPVLEQLSVLLGCIGGVYGFISWVKNRSQGGYHREFEKMIKQKDWWNHHEFAQTIRLTPDAAKQILVAFGYVWDNKKHLYIKSKETNKRINAIMKYKWNK